MGRWLIEQGKLPRGMLSKIADLMGTTTRTLRAWKRLAQLAEQGVMPRPVGRPAHSIETRRTVLWRVARARRREVKRAGWRTLGRHLDTDAAPTRLLQRGLSDLKARSRRREQRRREQLRVHLRVLARDVMWSQDATHLGRECGQSVEGQVARDVGTARNLSIWIGPPARGSELVAMLRRTAAERGSWPIVWVSDNGSCNVETELEAVLRENRVLHLRNLPRTPQHNAWIERGFREIKEETGLGKGAVLAGSPSSLTDLREWIAATGQERAPRWCRNLARAWHTLDSVHVRTSRADRSAAQLDTILPRAEDLVCRDRLYEAACASIERAVRSARTARERRRAEREAILETLERFGLVRRTRG